MVAVAGRGALASPPIATFAFRQQEMVHATDADHGIPHANSDTGAKNCDESLIYGSRHIVFAGSDLHLRQTGLGVMLTSHITERSRLGIALHAGTNHRIADCHLTLR